MKPKKALVTRWINNLRSGDFTQGQDTLYNTATQRHCCLGVLCEMEFGKPSSVGAYRYKGISLETDTGYFFSDITGLPANLESILIRANDCDDMTFDQIADLITIALVDPDAFSGLNQIDF